MLEYYYVGKMKALSSEEAFDLQKSTDPKLPFDYLNFLTRYGYGSIHGCFAILPSGKSTVGSAMGTGNVELEYGISSEEASSIETSPLIMETIDFDLVALGPDASKPFVVLPRESGMITYYSTLEGVINHYRQLYELPEELYFDPAGGRKVEIIEVSRDAKDKSERYENIQDRFLRKYDIDRSYCSNGISLHILQDIGGWVRFDDRVKLSIEVKYQEDFTDEANRVTGFLKNYVNRKKGINRAI